MKKVHTSVRLKEIMDERNLKQVDILRMAEPISLKYGERIGKNDISQYVSGKTEPGQKKLFILSRALEVNPAWLMGLEVPKHDTAQKKNDAITDIVLRLRADSVFLKVVKELKSLSPEQLQAVESFLIAFKQ